MTRMRLLSLALWGGLMVAAPLRAADSFEVGNEEAANARRQEVIYAKVEDAPAQAQRWVKDYLAKLPPGYKVRILNDMIYSNHPDNPGLVPMLYSMVPLTPEGLPDGEESFHRHWGGGVFRTQQWKLGKRHGPERFFERQMFDTADGKQEQRHVLKKEVLWEDDQIHGVQKTFFADGKVQSETAFVNGLAEGMARSYDERGRLVRESQMKAGRRHGLMKEYWPESGKPSKEVPYLDGKVHGVVKEYYANGQLKRELPFRDNLQHGEERQFEADGKLIRNRFWLKGDEASAEDFAKAGGK